jgi:Flp pilus assembly protein TadD
MHHYGRGVACANTGRFDQARSEAAAFEKHRRAVPKETATRRVLVHDVLEIARRMLAGETAFKSGDEQQGLDHLRRAVEMEDSLSYQEPSSWMMPARHALGALLLDAGEVEEAEAVYRKDLKLHRKNGWALHGLATCLDRKGRTDEAAAVRRRFDEVWVHATVKIKASCFCARGASDIVAK